MVNIVLMISHKVHSEPCNNNLHKVHSVPGNYNLTQVHGEPCTNDLAQSSQWTL